MTDIYHMLASHLDNLPAGFPATDSGVELKILKQLFTPEEAEAATALSLFPETAGAIAQRLGKDEAEIEQLYYSMSRKGLITRLGTARRLSVVWGVRAFLCADARDLDDMIAKARSAAVRADMAAAGQALVITAGLPFGTPGATNMLRIAYVTERDG